MAVQHGQPAPGKPSCSDSAPDSELSLESLLTCKKHHLEAAFAGQAPNCSQKPSPCGDLCWQSARALSNAKNPQDLSTRHKGEVVVLKNGSLAPQQWNFSSHCSKSYLPSPAVSAPEAGLSFAAAVAGQCQPPALRSHPAQPADLWPFPCAGAASLAGSAYPRAPPELHAAEEPASGSSYGSLLGLLQQERCLAAVQQCALRQRGSAACAAAPAGARQASHGSAPAAERKASSYQGSENPTVSQTTAGIQIHDRRQDLYF
ncbi:transcription cofactor vestigial-like protein 1 [Pogoniulus pusillus]|uniref:transcription cofactor vestigial-like protein 1 n=1 Tax=Pogoniulus pusillus TaxID=488313 RepID=UPI0030B92870